MKKPNSTNASFYPPVLPPSGVSPSKHKTEAQRKNLPSTTPKQAILILTSAMISFFFFILLSYSLPPNTSGFSLLLTIPQFLALTWILTKYFADEPSHTPDPKQAPPTSQETHADAENPEP